jgi:hypothetical protein
LTFTIAVRTIFSFVSVTASPARQGSAAKVAVPANTERLLISMIVSSENGLRQRLQHNLDSAGRQYPSPFPAGRAKAALEQWVTVVELSFGHTIYCPISRAIDNAMGDWETTEGNSQLQEAIDYHV